MFRTEHIRSCKADVDNKGLLEKRRKPNEMVNFGKIRSKIGRVDCLDDDGFPYVGANLQSGDILIVRCAECGADHSIKLKHTKRDSVQKVVLSANDEGKNFAVVSLRQARSPCLGDKFSSMHGQKGELGPTLEAALGKGIACGGSLKYATPFSTLSVDAFTLQLHRTGDIVRSLIFMGPTFYQRLNHMAEDKVKFCNTGPFHPLTWQPVQNRKKFGGIKLGEMERDCLIAHGAAAN
ncbi:DNA-directed RNA polymerase, subunit 2, hybrid-binding domain [Dillenia turbinata]|uniref:DNA-directed RNA polymerase n=1 Tax=Dillenia turbinata TaxID=194707 RepID=A0AAN8VHR7_9MAGN